MDKRIININGENIAVIQSATPVIKNTPTALDLMADLGYNDKCYRIVINKEAIAEEFFDLSTGIAGDILQKFITYSTKIAIAGDFSGYKSKALKDFIYECNTGNDIFFVADEQTALDKLAGAG